MTRNANFSRRRFIASSTLLSLVPLRAVLAAPACVSVQTNILGPAYRKGAPTRSTQLCAVDEPGTPLAMSGRVVTAQSCKALSAAVIDVWQVDAGANYDMDSAAFHMRGKFKSSKDGHYAFETILPVPYGRRPKHIHYLITREGYEPRITQCYFAGDERNASDPFVKKDLIVSPRPRTGDKRRSGAIEATFDIALEREHAVSAQDLRTYRDYIGDYEVAPGVIASIGVGGRRLRWHLSATENEGDAADGELLPRSRSRFFLPEYDMHVQFVRDEHGKVTHTLNDHGDLSRKIR